MYLQKLLLHKFRIDSYTFTMLTYLILVILAYFFILNFRNPDIFKPSGLDYYNYLIDAFFNLRLDISYKPTSDLSLYHEKLYLNWGPSPILYIFPFYLAGGIFRSDILYTFIAGCLNIFLFLFLIKEFNQYFKLKLSINSLKFLLISFAICSPNLYLSLKGQIWYTTLTISAFYSLIFLLFYFKYLNNPKKIKLLTIAVIFYNLAWLGRMPLVFYGLLFLYILFYHYKNKSHKLFLNSFLIFTTVTSLFSIFYLSYNYARFNNPFETGLSYHIADGRFKEIVESKNFFSFAYFSNNFNYYFLNHAQLELSPNLIKLDREAASIFSVYPQTLFIFYLFQKKFYQNPRWRLFIFFSFFIIILNLILYLTYFTTGGPQFGVRYFMDITPLTFLLITFTLRDIPNFIKYSILVYGVYINIVGNLIYTM